jgi:hypothetical protein
MSPSVLSLIMEEVENAQLKGFEKDYGFQKKRETGIKWM